MNSKQRSKPISLSTDLPNEPAEEQKGITVVYVEERQETRSNNGSHSQRWEESDTVVPQILPRQSEPQKIIEALRRPELPNFNNEVALSQQVSVDDCNRPHQGANSQSSARSDAVLQNSDFNLLEKMKQQELSRPIYFNVMVVGASGLGKTSFIDAFLHRKFEHPTIRESTSSIREVRGTRKEGQISFELCMIDTPGYRTAKHEAHYELLRKQLTSRLAKHQKAEQKLLCRDSVLRGDGIDSDDRIHCCLYFFSGPCLTNQDCYLMSMLQTYVSIIPVLARGDGYTKQQIQVIKANVHEQKNQKCLQWFECEQVLRAHHPTKLPELLEGPFGTAPPFVLVSSFDRIKFEGQKTIYGRQYGWGICNMENPEHSDFMLLYNLLLVYFSNILINLTATCQSEYVRRKLQTKPQSHSQLKTFGLCMLVAIAAVGLVKFKQH